MAAEAARTAVPESGPERQVTWAELFFDLVFVFAVTQVAGLLQADHSGAGMGRALVAFIPVYWVWVGTTMQANLREMGRARERLAVFAVALCGLLMALAVPDAYGARGLLFGAAYWAARLLLLAAVRSSYRGVAFNSFTAAAAITGPLLVAGGLVDGAARAALWTAAASVDLVVPWLVRARLAGIPYEPSHLTERYASLVIIALGESVVAVGSAASREPLTPERLIAVAVAFVVAGALGWLYFAFAAGAIRHSLRVAEVAIDLILPALPYGHLGFLAGIIGVAAAIGRVVDSPLDSLPVGAAVLLFGGTALYLATFGYTRWQISRSVAWPRLGAAAACLAASLVADRVPALLAAAALAGLLVALNALEASIVRRNPRWSLSAE